MKRLSTRRPSGAMIVAIIALVFAASGTAIAASKLVSGDKLIKKHSLSGNRLRNHTLTGTQINLNKLGKVPSAKHADSATTATSATSALSATNATNAVNATNATNAANATRAASSATTDNVKTWFATASVGQTVTLLTIGPFTYTGQCTSASSNPHAQTFVATSQPGSVADSYADAVNTGYPNTDSNVSFGPGTGPISVGYASSEDIVQTTAGTHWVGPYDGSDTQLSGDGHTYVNTFAAVGTDFNGADCVFVGHAIVITH